MPSPMISDREIWMAAKAMIQRYGSNAGIEKGHLELSATWQRIMTAIEKLQAEKPAPGERV
jgi:hypothetical protein